jgi:hypothetical protein
VIASESNVVHLNGTGSLEVDFGANNFSLPSGPDLLLSASATGNWGEAFNGDMKKLRGWGRSTNDLVIPGGTATAIAPPCIPNAGFTESCAERSLDIPFTRGAGDYALTGREVITQTTSDVIGASYTDTVTRRSSSYCRAGARFCSNARRSRYSASGGESPVGQEVQKAVNATEPEGRSGSSDPLRLFSL